MKSSGTTGILVFFLVCLILLLSAAWMVWEIVEYAHPERKFREWGIPKPPRGAEAPLHPRKWGPRYWRYRTTKLGPMGEASI